MRKNRWMELWVALLVVTALVLIAGSASAAPTNLQINTTNGSVSWTPDIQTFDPPGGNPNGAYYVLDYEWDLYVWGSDDYNGDTAGGGDPWYSASNPGTFIIDLPGSGPLPYGLYMLTVQPDPDRLYPNHPLVEYTLFYIDPNQVGGGGSGPAMTSVTLSGTATGASIGWSAEAGATEYEILLMGTNGLERRWIDVTVTGLSFNWSAVFPGQNIYTTWTAFVRAYNADGTDGPWMQSSSITPALPSVAALDFTVSDIYGTGLVTGARTNIREVLVEWPQFSASNIINFDPNLVTFELIAQMSGDSTEKYEVTGINNGTSSINVPVGELGKVITYHFTVDVFYDGVKLTTVTAPDNFDLTIDLKGPLAVTLAVPTISTAVPYNWLFSWTRATETDPQYGADVLIERMEGIPDESVDSSWTHSYFGIPTPFSLAAEASWFFDKIFGDFRITVTPFDNLGNRGVPASRDFTLSAPVLSPSISGFNSTQVTWGAVSGAFSYDLEISSENGFHSWTGLTGTSQSIDWADLFPGTNVYKVWHARVRAHDHDGNAGAWSDDYSFGFDMPAVTQHPFQVRHANGETASISTPMTDRELYITFLKLSAAPTGFINWDANRVTFELEVDLPGDVGWYYVLLQNQWNEEGHVVPVGVEGYENSYMFYFRPLYDGVPMTGLSIAGPYIIDLQAPGIESLDDMVVGDTLLRPDYEWIFGWEPEITGYDEETPIYAAVDHYGLNINRLEATDGTVDASVTIDVEGDELGLSIDPRDYFDFIFGRFEYSITAFDGLGNSSESEPKYFTFAAPTLAPTIAGFDSTTLSWNQVDEAVEYELEISSENGTHTWTKIAATTDPTQSLSINWAALFPDCNVYKRWHAKVRAYDHDGNVGAWSPDYQFDFVLPQMVTSITYSLADTVNDYTLLSGVRTNSEQINVFWNWNSATPPAGFINWDTNKLSYYLDIRIGTTFLPWYSVEVRDQGLLWEGETVLLGTEGESATYRFELWALYDGERFSPTGTKTLIIDLQGPNEATDLSMTPVRPPAGDYSWPFIWTWTNFAVPLDISNVAVSYDVVIERLEGTDDTVDAAVTIHTTNTFLTIDPTEYFDTIFGRFRWTVIPYDATNLAYTQGNPGVPATAYFTFEKPTLKPTISGFDSTTLTWNQVAEAVEYELEISSENGTHTWTKIPATTDPTQSISLDWAALFPGSNVYKIWHAKVRAMDHDGNMGAWSGDPEDLSNVFNFLLPTISDYDFDVRHLSGSVASIGIPMNDRQLRITFNMFTTPPAGFINWDPNRVTFDLQVDSNSVGSWYYVLLQNQFITEGHIVPVGAEGYVRRYFFYFRPLYDGVPMMSGWAQSGSYIIDLEPPGPVALTAMVEDVNLLRPDYEWVFSWTPSTPAEDIARYELTIKRLEAEEGTSDAEVMIPIEPGTTLTLSIDPEDYFDYIFGRFEYSIVAYDGLGNVSLRTTEEFTFDAPDLTTEIMSFDEEDLVWSAADEGVSYDVEIRSENGHHLWEGQTDLFETIDWAVLFPDCNVYKTWQARVRAHDRDGNIGPWSDWVDEHSEFIFPLPPQPALNLQVYTKYSGLAPTDGTYINERYLSAIWTGYSSETPPEEGFINWDINKVTYELNVERVPGIPFMMVEFRNEDLLTEGYLLQLGEEGDDAMYYIRAYSLYDGVPFSVEAEYGPVIIDLRPPNKVWLDDVETDRPDYLWTFEWMPYLETDPAVSYDLIIERLEAVDALPDTTPDEVVDAAVTIHVVSENELVTKAIDPTEYFDFIFRKFRYTVVPFDKLGNAGLPVVKEFVFPGPDLTAEVSTFTANEVTWAAVDEAVKYDLDIRSENGYHRWDGLTATSQTIDWADLFPGANVYRIWSARVRAYDRDGNVGAWSGWLDFNHALPQITGYEFSVLNLDYEEAELGEPMNDRQLLVRFHQMATAPVGFINWDPDLVTFSLEVDALSFMQGDLGAWHGVILANLQTTWTDGHIVPVGIEDDVVAYAFKLKVLYDDQPMMQDYQTKVAYIVDLMGPGAVTLENVVTSRPVYNWHFSWIVPGGGLPVLPNGGIIGGGINQEDGVPPLQQIYDAVKYDLIVRRLEAEDGTVDAEVWIEILGDVELPPATFFDMDPEEYFDFIFGRFEYQVIAYDELGNASESEWLGFEFTKPPLTMGDVSLTNESVSWDAVSEAVKYEIELKSDNGTYRWNDVTSLSVVINWVTMFPGANVYQTWQARVRAYDHDGNYGSWSGWAGYVKGLPPLAAIAVSVNKASNLDPAPVSTRMTERALILSWTQPTPSVFDNYDQDLVTYKVYGTADTTYEHIEFNYLVSNFSPTSLKVDVGIEGAETRYSFSVLAFYDGELWSTTNTWAGPYIIDLKGPAKVTLNDVVPTKPAYNWSFSWTRATEADPAASYDLIVERLEAAGDTVDASVTFHQTGTTKAFDPRDHFDYIFARFRYTVIPYDGLGNAGEPESKTFEFTKPTLTMGTVTLTDLQASWAAVTEAVSYDIELRSDNGTYNWYDVTATSVAINWAALFPGANVYQTWLARVRAYDHDGNYGLWSDWAQYAKPFPTNSAVIYSVLRSSNGAGAPTATLFKEESLRVTWNQYAMPTGFVNWDPDLITFELVMTESVDAQPAVTTVKQELANIGNSSVEVPVGVAGKVATYKFRVRTFYDGELLNDGTESLAYLIDLEGPAAVTLGTKVLERPTYKWTFSWTRATQADPAASYDLIIDELEAIGTVVESSWIYHTAGNTKWIYPQDYFDDIFGRFRYTVIPYDALGNAGAPISEIFTFDKPSLYIATIVLNDIRVDWEPVSEAVKYDIELKSDNGTYNWYDWTATDAMIGWSTMFPGANVYQVWQARVRAYDHDGNYGEWSAWATYEKQYPYVPDVAMEVRRGSNNQIAPVGVAMNEDKLHVWWPNFAEPAGFVNFDMELVTYDLIVMASNEFGSHDYKHTINAMESTAVLLDVGVLGTVTQYSFYVNLYYDGEMIRFADVVFGPYIIDLKAPADPTGMAEAIAGEDLWRFWWTAPTDADLAGYFFELQKYDDVNKKWAPACASDEIPVGTNETFVDPLTLYWSVFGDFRWRVRAFDNLDNVSEGDWRYFDYTLDESLAPERIFYELLGEHQTLDMDIEYATADQVRFHWSTPVESVPGVNMGMVFYKIDLLVGTEGEGWIWEPEQTYLMPWIAGSMIAKFDVGESGLTKHYMGRVQAIYLSEYSDAITSDVFAIDLERPEFEEGVTAPSYSSTTEEYPSWLFTWGDAYDQEVGLGGFLFVLERLEGGTTHAVAILDLPVEYEEEPEEEQVGGFEFSYVEGMYMLEMDPFEFVETIDGIYRYTVVPYDRLDNLGWPIAGEFTSVWTDGGSEGTYPVINLYNNWMGEIQELGDVNNNTYATVSFDIYGMEGYTLEFKLNGTLLVEGTDYRLIELPEDGYPGDLHYLVLLESVRDMIQADSEGELTIEAYIEESGIRVQFTIDAFGYDYLNQRTGFGFGRFRPALND